MDTAALTVVVPVHNGGAWLADTLESLRRQSAPLAEVIVVDDASDDDSVAVAQQHALAPRVIRLDHNRGVAFARNTGLLAAGTDFVAFVDQDDLWLPTRVQRLLDVLAADPSRQVLITSERVFAAEEDRAQLRAAAHPFADWVEFWRPRADVLSLLDDVQVSPDPPSVTSVPRTRVLAGSVTVTTSYVLPRMLSLQVGGFASWLRSADDWMLLQSLARHTSVHRVDDPTVLYRVHPTNTSVASDWPMPLMVSAAAARFGGGIVDRGRARDAGEVGRLSESDFLMHQMTAQASSTGPRVVADSLAVWQLLATDRQDRRRSGARLLSVLVSSRLPARVRDALRRVRRAVRA